jgi:hypothetical protein
MTWFTGKRIVLPVKQHITKAAEDQQNVGILSFTGKT